MSEPEVPTGQISQKCRLDRSIPKQSRGIFLYRLAQGRPTPLRRLNIVAKGLNVKGRTLAGRKDVDRPAKTLARSLPKGKAYLMARRSFYFLYELPCLKINLEKYLKL